MKKFLIIKIISISIAVVVAGIALIFLINSCKNSNTSRKNGISTADLKTVVTEIKQISEYTTLCYYKEMPFQITETEEALFGLREKTKELVFIAKGKVRAGFDLSKINEDDLSISGDTLTVNAPKAQIFDIIVNPSDFEVYYEKGKWNHDELAKNETEAKGKIKEDAIQFGLLEKAEERGVEKLQAFFQAFGFKYVIINFKESTNTAE